MYVCVLVMSTRVAPAHDSSAILDVVAGLPGDPTDPAEVADAELGCGDQLLVVVVAIEPQPHGQRAARRVSNARERAVRQMVAPVKRTALAV